MSNTKMFDKNYMELNRLTHPFGEDRKEMYKKYGEENGKHEGIDLSCNNMARLDVWNNLSGVLRWKEDAGAYGNSVCLIHNAKFVNGADEEFYSQYCHLKNFDNKALKGYCQFGTRLGTMGNTGNSQGVHLHLMFYQMNIVKNQTTKLLNDIIEILKPDNKRLIALWQFNKLFFNPEIIFEYFEKLQGVL